MQSYSSQHRITVIFNGHAFVREAATSRVARIILPQSYIYNGEMISGPTRKILLYFLVLSNQKTILSEY
jgi:hypothetical protein